MQKLLENKIIEVKDALERGEITKQDINNNAEYSIGQRILKGLNVREKSVDRLLAKIHKIRKNNKTKSSDYPKVPSGVKEIAIDNVIDDKTNDYNIDKKFDIEKEQAVKEFDIEEEITNLKTKSEFSKVPSGVKEIAIDNVIDDKTNDYNINEKFDIEKEQAVKEFDIEEEITNLKAQNRRLKQENQFLKGELERKNKERPGESKTVIEPSITVKDNSNDVIEIVTHHEQVINDILKKIAHLEEQIVTEKSFTSTEKNPGYHGFSVSRLSSGYWQAVRRINGHPQCIYIGRDTALAQEKIEKWLEKYYPDILKEEHL